MGKTITLTKSESEEKKNGTFRLNGIHDNIVTEMAVESLFKNLDHIPVAELEAFINKYKKQ